MTDSNRPPHHLSDPHPSSSSQDLQIPSTTHETGHSDADSHYVPRPKRIACVLCRRRKLRCDGKRPSCGTCSRLGHECVFDEVRKKSGPKRGYVKQLEARLAQVENLLKNQKTNPPLDQGSDFPGAVTNHSTDISEILSIINESSESQQHHDRISDPFPAQAFQQAGPTNSPDYGMEMISLGLEEPLPSQEIIDELNEIYFEKIHPGIPILHRPRLLVAMSLGPSIRPPLCLQYIMWSHAASISDKYSSLHSVFYERARKYAEADELKGLGEHAVSLGHCQAWVLICTYEFKMMFFPRAWLSSGKAARLGIMIGLNRVDGEGIDVKQTLTAAKDWNEKEERRRVFWMAYCADRFASIGTGWPVVFDDRDVLTNLPASEEAFLKNQPQDTVSLEAAHAGEGMPTLSAFGGVAFMASIFGKNLAHLHRPNPHDDDHDLNGVYWQRHRSHDNILLHFSLTMPSHLRLSVGTTDPNVIFCNMAIHTATICLHQAAIFKAEKNKMPGPIATESKRRCILAAEQISNILRLSSHVDPSKMNVLTPFCVYVAARVFVQYLKFRPDDSAARSSLQFVFSALHLLKTKNPLAESFIFQLDLDTAGTVLSDFNQSKKACFMRAGLQRDAAFTERRYSSDSSLLNVSQTRVQPDPDPFDASQGSCGSSSRSSSVAQQIRLEVRQANPSLSDAAAAAAHRHKRHRTQQQPPAFGDEIHTPDRDLSHPVVVDYSGGSSSVDLRTDSLSPDVHSSSATSSYTRLSPQQPPGLANNSFIATPASSLDSAAAACNTNSTAANLMFANPAIPLDAGAGYPDVFAGVPRWDVNALAFSGLDGSTLDNSMSGGLDGLSEAQWAQLLTTNWDAYPDPNILP